MHTAFRLSSSGSLIHNNGNPQTGITSIYLDAVIVLFALSFDKTNELFRILFRIGIRKGVTTVVPNLFVVQVFCQCRYVRSGPSSQFEWFFHIEVCLFPLFPRLRVQWCPGSKLCLMKLQQRRPDPELVTIEERSVTAPVLMWPVGIIHITPDTNIMKFHQTRPENGIPCQKSVK